MPATVTAHFEELINSSYMPEAAIVLAKIAHPEVDAPIFVARNTEHVYCQGQKYERSWFEIELVTDTDQQPRCSVSLLNVNKRIGQTILAMRARIKISFYIVVSGEPDVIIRQYLNFHLSNVSSDGVTISGDLTKTDYSTLPYPALIATKARAPALFRN